MIVAAVRNAMMVAKGHAQAKRSVTLTPNERLRIQRGVLDAMFEHKEDMELVNDAIKNRASDDVTFSAAIDGWQTHLDDLNGSYGDDVHPSIMKALDAVVDAYVSYMTLRLRMRDSSKKLGPSKLVDLVWHVHILDTVSYAAFCDRCFGGFVHHDPGVNEGQFYNTLEAFEQHPDIPRCEQWWNEGVAADVTPLVTIDGDKLRMDSTRGAGCG